MSTITKERVAGIANGEKCYTHDDVVELARIALASLEAEAVAWIIEGGNNDTPRHISTKKEYAEAYPDREVTPLYTAPPAPVSVPEPIQRNDADGWWMYKGRRVGGVCAEWYNRALDDCRAAILQDAGGNSTVVPDGWVLVPVEPTEDMIVNGFESEPDESFSDEKEWEEYDAMSGCQQAAHRAKLCYAAMIAAAPKP